MSLAAATRSELTKQFSTAIWWILALVLAVYVGLVATGFAFVFAGVATGAIGGTTGPQIDGGALAPLIYSVATSFGYVFPLLIGTLMVTSEFRHKTLTPTFLSTPRRGRVLTAKVLVGVVLGVLYAAIGIAAAVGPGAGILAAFGLSTGLDTTDGWALIGRMVIGFVLWTLVGIGIGSVVRNQVVAIVLVLAFTQFLEPIARVAGGLVPAIDPVTRVLPGAAGDALVGASALTLGMTGTGDPLEWWAGGLVLLGYALVFLVLGQVTSWRRDVN